MRESKPDTKYINPKEEDTLISGQDITQYDNIPYVYPLELMGYTFVRDHDETNKHYEIREFLY